MPRHGHGTDTASPVILIFGAVSTAISGEILLEHADQGLVDLHPQTGFHDRSATEYMYYA